MSQSRQPKGIPVGGQYAENAHDEAGASLDGFLFTGGDDTVIESGSGEWRSGGVIAFELNDGTEIEVDTGSNLPSYIDPQYEALADGNIRVRYATVDTDPGDYDEEDPISRFADIESRNDFVRAKLDEGYSPEQIQVPFLFSNGGQSGSEYRGSAADEGWEDSTFGSRDYDVLVVGEAQDGWADRGVAAGNLRDVIGFGHRVEVFCEIRLRVSEAHSCLSAVRVSVDSGDIDESLACAVPLDEHVGAFSAEGQTLALPWEVGDLQGVELRPVLRDLLSAPGGAVERSRRLIMRVLGVLTADRDALGLTLRAHHPFSTISRASSPWTPPMLPSMCPGTP